MEKSSRRTALYIIPWTSLLGGFLLGALSGEGSEIVGAWLLLFSALLFGLPHGAYDFWILFDSTRRERRSFRALFGMLATYLTLALVVVVVWYFLPGTVLIGFLALTAWHFGSGDAIWETENQSDWFINSLGRGLLVMSAPLAFYQLESGAVLAKLDAHSAEILLAIAPYTLTVGIALIVFNNFAAFFRNSKIPFTNRLLTLSEALLLLTFFRLTTPLLAVTVYLIGVHSWRHLLRLELYEQSEQVFNRQNLWQLIARFHHRALPVTLVSLVGLVLIFWLLKLRLLDFANYTSAYLVLLSALTLPHAALITWTELKRRKMS
ncbi:MAG: Brp/Blh family beta-carotene 15,15'-dioxygenase [Pyrinomonadaceae bacterium]